VRKYGTVSSVSGRPTPQSTVFDRALEANIPRNNWTKEEIKEIYDTPLMKLAFAAVWKM
jgi:biotin synthase